MYSIGEVSKKFNITISALRYYDKEGLLKDIKRNSSGIRKFDENDLDTLTVIECLKKTGMKIKDIKTFLDWCNIGDSTIPKRRNMFYERKKEVANQITELQKVLDFVNYKCWYYDEAMKYGTVEKVESKPEMYVRNRN